MPFESLNNHSEVTWALWKITEDEPTLTRLSGRAEPVPSQMNHNLKRLEFLAGRVLIQKMLSSLHLEFNGLVKDEFGKPFLAGHKKQISLSHSYPYVAACISSRSYAGIDIEQPKPKLLRVAPRILSPAELADAGSDMVKHCVYWCAKESLVKVHGRKDLVFAENLLIDAFSLQKEGELIGRIIVDNRVTAIPLHYSISSDFVVVVNK